MATVSLFKVTLLTLRYGEMKGTLPARLNYQLNTYMYLNTVFDNDKTLFIIFSDFEFFFATPQPNYMVSIKQHYHIFYYKYGLF